MSKGGIPETITLADGTVVNVKDNPAIVTAIETAMQNARKEEKDKLYSTIAQLEASKKVLEGDKKTIGELSETQKKKLEEIEKELVTLKVEKEALEKKDPAKKDPKDDDKKPAGDGGLTKADIMEMLEGFSKKQSEEFEQKLQGLSGKFSTKTVSDYREKALAKYSGVIIDDFVPENLKSEEEVDKAIQTALEKSKKYISKEYDIDGKKQKMTLEEFEKFEKENKDDNPDGGGDGGKTPTYQSKKAPEKPDQGGGGDLTGKDLLSKIKDMTDEEYAKNHDQILKEAKSFTYTGGADN